MDSTTGVLRAMHGEREEWEEKKEEKTYAYHIAWWPCKSTYVRTYVDTNDESCCVPLAMARYVYNSKQWSQVVEIEREGERERGAKL